MREGKERAERTNQGRGVLERFKRHFMLVRKARKALGEAQLTWEMSFDPSSFRSKVKVPEGMPTFSALMRPLLDPESELSLRKVWEHLRADERLSLTEEDVAAVERAFAAAGKGGGKMIWNDQEVSGWDMYDRVAKGAYFDEQKAQARFLEALEGHPARGLLWFTFWTFQDDSYRLASWLFAQACAATSPESANGDAPVPSGRCLFCRQQDGGFSSEEHVFPESLIGDADRLPKGLVCDRCNHGLLSQLDQALVGFGPLALQRVVQLPYTKKGKLPRAEVGDLLITKVQPRVLRIEGGGEGALVLEGPPGPNGEVRFNLRASLARVDWITIARALAKIALELIALKQGAERAMSADFDSTRRFVLEGADIRGWLLLRPSCKPETGVHTQWIENAQSSAFAFNILGWEAGLILRGEPQIDEAAAAEAGLVVIPLFGDRKPYGAVTR